MQRVHVCFSFVGPSSPALFEKLEEPVVAEIACSVPGCPSFT